MLDKRAASAIFVTFTASSGFTIRSFSPLTASRKFLISTSNGSCFSFLGISEFLSVSILISCVTKSDEIIPSVQIALKCRTLFGVIQLDDIKLFYNAKLNPQVQSNIKKVIKS